LTERKVILKILILFFYKTAPRKLSLFRKTFLNELPSKNERAKEKIYKLVVKINLLNLCVYEPPQSSGVPMFYREKRSFAP